MTGEQSVFEFELATTMSGDNFIVSDSNREAVEWLGNTDGWPAPVLIVYGALSSGKTHLCQIWREMYQANVITADDLSNDHVMATLLRPNQFYYIDDVDSVLQQSEAVQKGLFHLYNTLVNEGGYLLLTASRAPKQIGIDLPDLSSRLLAVPSVEIKDPDEQTLQTLFFKFFDDQQILIKKEVIAFLLPRLDRSYQAIHEAVLGLNVLSLKGKRPITIPLAREWLSSQGK